MVCGCGVCGVVSVVCVSGVCGSVRVEWVCVCVVLQRLQPVKY